MMENKVCEHKVVMMENKVCEHQEKCKMEKENLEKIWIQTRTQRRIIFTTKHKESLLFVYYKKHL